MIAAQVRTCLRVRHSELGPKAVSTLIGMAGIEEIDEGVYLPFKQWDFQVADESADRQTEVVPHEDDRLEVLAVAMPQGGDELGFSVGVPGEEPLLELVDGRAGLLAGTGAPGLCAPAARESTRPESRERAGQAFFRSVEEPLSFGVVWGRFDVDGSTCSANRGKRTAFSREDYRGPTGRRPGRL